MSQYDKQCSHFEAFTIKIFELIKDLLKENAIQVHSITHRTKEKSSVERKISSSPAKYYSLELVTDISGVRITTFYADDLDRVASIVETEFEIDRENSIDKRAIIDPDRFGYLSLHYVAKLNPARLRLTEYKKYDDCKVEIQIRSILQHAWAEIEHDLGYKGKSAVPRDIRRRFSRLAGLLEIADSEFIEIRNSLLVYEKEVANDIAKSPSDVLIDSVSLFSYVRSSPLIKDLDRDIAKIMDAKIISRKEFMNILIEELKYIGLKTIAELDSLLIEKRHVIANFAERWIASKSKEVSRGVCLAYLVYVIIGEKDSLEEATTYLQVNRIGAPSMREETAKRIVSLTQSAKETDRKTAKAR